MNKGEFNKNDLIKLNEQYSVRHQSTDKFEIGERVFLKSNPEHPLIIYDIDEDLVYCYFEKTGTHIQEGFKPQTILQYRYAHLKERTN